MAARTLISIPTIRDEGRAGQWPTFDVDPNVLDIYIEPKTKRRVLPRALVGFGRRTWAAALKGVVLSIFVIGIALGVLPARLWWLSGWHWAGGLAVVLGTALLLGVDGGMLALGVILGAQAVAPLRGHLLLAGELAAITVGARVAWDWLLAIFRR